MCMFASQSLEVCFFQTLRYQPHNQLFLVGFLHFSDSNYFTQENLKPSQPSNKGPITVFNFWKLNSFSGIGIFGSLRLWKVYTCILVQNYGGFSRNVAFFHYFWRRLTKKKIPVIVYFLFLLQRLGFAKRAKGGFFSLYSAEAGPEKTLTSWGFSWKTWIPLGLSLHVYPR